MTHAQKGSLTETVLLWYGLFDGTDVHVKHVFCPSRATEGSSQGFSQIEKANRVP